MKYNEMDTCIYCAELKNYPINSRTPAGACSTHSRSLMGNPKTDNTWKIWVQVLY